MNVALQKTLVLLLLLGLGGLLRSRMKSQESLGGIKELILTVALPSTIFIALMKVNLDSSLVFVPILTLALNLLIFYTLPLLFPIIGLAKNSPAGRTLMLLIPSLAPGLSCFPFIAEFLGEKDLALAALADVGNKFFVLIFLYIMALNMFLDNGDRKAVNITGKIRHLLLSLFKEPVNGVIVLALLLLSFGVQYSRLPTVITDLMDKTAALMTPLVLIYIGLAVQLKAGRKKLVMSVLLFRAGISILISVAVIALLRIQSPNLLLLMVVIPLSSASFWPLAHITAFHHRENQQGLSKERRSFDPELAVLLLAFSLPFSSMLILGILSAGNMFTDPVLLVALGMAFIIAGIIPHLKVFLAQRYSKTG
ncbi:MAG: hypothetical protein QM664_07305 [Flavihumibacter sp.]